MSSTSPKMEVAKVFGQVTEKMLKKSKGKSVKEHAENPKQEKQSKTETKIELEMDSPVCRICLEGEIESGLISPCLCSGSCALVHLKCLRLWLTTSTSARKTSTDICEICQSAYKLKIVRADPHFRQYVRENPRVLVDMATFLLLTLFIFAVWAVIVVCATQILFVYKSLLPEDSEVRIWTVSTVLYSSLLLFLCVYFAWIYTTIRAKISKWNQWKIEHPRVKLFSIDPQNTNNNKNCNTEAISIFMETETETDQD